MQGTALVKAVSEDGVSLAWNTWQDPSPPAPVALVLAMPRPRVLRRLWRQVAELGVSRVVLTLADTVPPGYSTSEALRPHVVLREVLQVLPPQLGQPSLCAGVPTLGPSTEAWCVWFV